MRWLWSLWTRRLEVGCGGGTSPEPLYFERYWWLWSLWTRRLEVGCGGGTSPEPLYFERYWWWQKREETEEWPQDLSTFTSKLQIWPPILSLFTSEQIWSPWVPNLRSFTSKQGGGGGDHFGESRR
ncbi:Uncharacterized protein Fot_06039 [Forsythia ovata]|uniref:Uncharacterized protein n=1 Tax=Forsythia ovata TaxID=205694 RepID=A0ABD1WRU0_9LAMI